MVPGCAQSVRYVDQSQAEWHSLHILGPRRLRKTLGCPTQVPEAQSPMHEQAWIYPARIWYQKLTSDIGHAAAPKVHTNCSSTMKPVSESEVIATRARLRS